MGALQWCSEGTNSHELGFFSWACPTGGGLDQLFVCGGQLHALRGNGREYLGLKRKNRRHKYSILFCPDLYQFCFASLNIFYAWSSKFLHYSPLNGKKQIIPFPSTANSISNVLLAQISADIPLKICPWILPPPPLFSLLLFPVPPFPSKSETLNKINNKQNPHP